MIVKAGGGGGGEKERERKCSLLQNTPRLLIQEFHKSPGLVMRPSGPALRGSSSVWWADHVIPAHEGLIDEVLMLKWSSGCRSFKEPLPVRAQRWGEIFTLPSQNSANDCYEMKTNLQRMDKGRREGLSAKFCNLIFLRRRQENKMPQECLLLLQRWRLASCVSVQMVDAASVWF